MFSEGCLVLNPPNELVFRGPFTEKVTCQLHLTNTSDKCIGFKMKCTAARYYASNPAVGVIPPNETTVISVFLSDLDVQNSAEIDYKKHRFGITYLPVPYNCTSQDVDRILKSTSRNNIQIAYLRSVIVADDEEYVPSLLPKMQTLNLSDPPLQSAVEKLHREKPSPPVPAAKPVRRTSSSDRGDYIRELQMKDSVIAELQKEKEELMKIIEAREQLVAETRASFNQERERLVKQEQQFQDRFHQQLASVRDENDNLKLSLNLKTINEKRLGNEMEDVLKMNQQFENELTFLRDENDRLRDNEWAIKQESTKIQLENQRLCNDLVSLTREHDRVKMVKGMQGNESNDAIVSDISFWEVSHNDFETSEVIGTGAYGYVSKGFYKEQLVAIKCIHKHIMSAHTMKVVRREVAMLARVRHPCLLLFIGVSFDHPTGSLMIITELMECSLREAYNKREMLNGKSKVRIMVDVACALHYLHTHKEKILHRDVSSANVLVYETVNKLYRGKLSDFGSANLAQLSVTHVPGAHIYTAPEVLEETSPGTSKQTTKIDVYSYGILLCEVFAREPRLPLPKEIESMKESIRNQFPFMYEQILKCTSLDPDGRPEIISVLRELKTKFNIKF